MGKDQGLPQGVLHQRAQTRARINGAPSYLNFFITYPMTPKRIIVKTS